MITARTVIQIGEYRHTSVMIEITSVSELVKFPLTEAIVSNSAITTIFVTPVGILTATPAVPIPSGKPSIAVMYFKNNTGDEELDHWRSALSQWLITDLSQSKYINV